MSQPPRHLTQNVKADSPRTGNAEAISRRTAWLFQPESIAALAVFRIGLGTLLLWEVSRYWTHGWIESAFVRPGIHFHYWGFAWLSPLPADGMHVLFALLGCLAACIAAGFHYWWSARLFALGWAYVFLLEKSEYLNHQYLLCLISALMCVIPAQAAWSVDALLHRVPRATTAPAWTLWLLRVQIAIPYVFGGLAKLNSDWLHGLPLEIWMPRMAHIREIWPGFGSPSFALFCSHAGALLDLLVVPALLSPRTRFPAMLCAAAFHVLNLWMFHIGVFPWFMLLATTLFLPSDWPLRLGRRIARRPATGLLESTWPSPSPRLVRFGLVAWFTVQLLVPLRHLLYPGPVAWTEEGYRFSWRMMLSDKTSAVAVFLVDGPTGPRETVDLRRYLSPRQIDKLGQYPDLMLEFSHTLRKELIAQGREHWEVHALDYCSLNGRRPQLLIDPRVDLSRLPWTLGHANWIVPLREPARHPPFTLPPSQWGPWIKVPADAQSPLPAPDLSEGEAVDL